jgi:large subunit ribosomal protein L15
MNLADVKKIALTYPTGSGSAWHRQRGRGKTSGRGHKGAKARSAARPLGQEGGQMPLPAHPEARLQQQELQEGLHDRQRERARGGVRRRCVVDLAAVLSIGLVSKEKHTELFKVLGDGELKKKLHVRADAVYRIGPPRRSSRRRKVEIRDVVYRGKF